MLSEPCDVCFLLILSVCDLNLVRFGTLYISLHNIQTVCQRNHFICWRFVSFSGAYLLGLRLVKTIPSYESVMQNRVKMLIFLMCIFLTSRHVFIFSWKRRELMYSDALFVQDVLKIFSFCWSKQIYGVG